MATSDWRVTVPSDRDPQQHYTVQCKQGVYSCSCLAWRTQRSPITQRTCKHLIRVRGAEAERRRAPESFYGLTRAKRTDAPAPPERPPLMSYQTWQPARWPPDQLRGWYVSVKLDGAWARWADGRLVTKSGRALQPPPSVTDRLPREADVDGEVYHPDRQKVRKAVLGHQWDDDVRFVVFDLFDTTQPFRQRWARLQKLHRQYHFAMVPEHTLSDDHPAADLKQLQDAAVAQGEEGLVLRDPEGLYQPGRRSATTLKWKPLQRGHARVEACLFKKIGTRLTLREPDHPPHASFHVYTRQPPTDFGVGQTVTFVYAGRDDRDRPELARLAAPEPASARRAPSELTPPNDRARRRRPPPPAPLGET